MKINIRGYITHKEAEKYSDCADRYAANTSNNHFAIADGVSKSFFPDYWADILVNEFVTHDLDKELSIENCQIVWLNKVADKVNAPDVKWYTKNAFIRQEPGLATFVGLRIEGGKWFASALGDSFLFFVPNGVKGFDEWIKLSSKPLPIVFDSFPDYYSSRNKQHGEIKRIEHSLVEGTFYLMTDALSEWVFDKQNKAIEEINEKWHNQEEFERSITELRLLNVLNNDDSAILIISVENDGENNLTYGDVEIQNLMELVEKEKDSEVETLVTQKETFVEEVKSSNLNKVSISDNLPIKKENQQIFSTEIKDEIELSQNAQVIFNKCLSVYGKSLKQMESIITSIGKFSKRMKISVEEQKKIKEKLKEYGISFKN
ncbi:MAG: hypothetical protein IPO21_11405 [Bacteroidales bacterium]|nr:hypothetical protein [Bacteroidales bacterium]